MRGADLASGGVGDRRGERQQLGRELRHLGQELLGRRGEIDAADVQPGTAVHDVVGPLRVWLSVRARGGTPVGDGQEVDGVLAGRGKLRA